MRKSSPVVAGVVMALLLVGCGSTNTRAKSGGTLKMGTTGSLISLNKFAGPTGIYAAFEFMYPALVQYDLHTLASGSTSGTTFKPDFATSWQASPDGLTWTFHTRPGAKWSDGQPLTAADVAFTLNTVVQYQKGATANYAAAVAHLKGAEATSPTTVVLHYSQAVSNVLFQMQTLGILPQHVFGPLATGDGMGLKTFANTPTGGQPSVSGGPFEVTQFVPNSVLIFSRNPNYYGKAPKVDGVGVEEFANPDAMLAALRTRQIDAAVGVPQLLSRQCGHPTTWCRSSRA